MRPKSRNAVTEEYIDSLLDTKAVATQRVNAWLAERLNELSVQVEEADDAVVDFKAKMIDDAGGSEETINQLLAELNTRLVASTTDRADSEIRLQTGRKFAGGRWLGRCGRCPDLTVT